MDELGIRLDAPSGPIELGLNRFFNDQNLDRYRRLASEVITAPERQRLIQLLAKEMNAFRRETARVYSGSKTPNTRLKNTSRIPSPGTYPLVEAC